MFQHHHEILTYLQQMYQVHENKICENLQMSSMNENLQNKSQAGITSIATYDEVINNNFTIESLLDKRLDDEVVAPRRHASSSGSFIEEQIYYSQQHEIKKRMENDFQTSNLYNPLQNNQEVNNQQQNVNQYDSIPKPYIYPYSIYNHPFLINPNLRGVPMMHSGTFQNIPNLSTNGNMSHQLNSQYFLGQSFRFPLNWIPNNPMLKNWNSFSSKPYLV